MVIIFPQGHLNWFYFLFSPHPVPVIESYEKPILQKKIKIEPGIEPQRTDYYPEEMSPPLMNSVSPPQVAMLQE